MFSVQHPSTTMTTSIVHEDAESMHRMLVSTNVPVSAAKLYAFHERADAFEKLVPPWQKLRVVSFERKGGGLDVGTHVVVEIKVGPVWVRWVSRHTACIPGEMFSDEQVKGPFARFEHEHRMVAVGSESSRLEDDIHYRLPLEPLSLLALGAIRADMERSFRYRHEVTLRALLPSQ
jgi:uncharacterized protein